MLKWPEGTYAELLEGKDKKLQDQKEKKKRPKKRRRLCATTGGVPSALKGGERGGTPESFITSSNWGMKGWGVLRADATKDSERNWEGKELSNFFLYWWRKSIPRKSAMLGKEEEFKELPLGGGTLKPGVPS